MIILFIISITMTLTAGMLLIKIKYLEKKNKALEKDSKMLDDLLSRIDWDI